MRVRAIERAPGQHIYTHRGFEIKYGLRAYIFQLFFFTNAMIWLYVSISVILKP